MNRWSNLYLFQVILHGMIFYFSSFEYRWDELEAIACVEHISMPISVCLQIYLKIICTCDGPVDIISLLLLCDKANIRQALEWLDGWITGTAGKSSEIKV